jgi:uncharacterized membrane protein YeaQ/YmgE (transglycosylase-associated protein family)
MAAHGIIVWIIIGAVAGWLAGLLVKGSGFGLFADIAVGIVGAFVGGWLAGLLGIGTGAGLIGSIKMHSCPEILRRYSGSSTIFPRRTNG